MKIADVLKPLRGAVVTTLTWSAVWAAVGAVYWFVRPPEGDALALGTLLPAALFWGQIGAYAGATFAALLFASGRRRIAQLSMPRIAAWGAMAGLLLPFGTTLGAAFRRPSALAPSLVELLVEFGVLGALCAAGALAVARRGSARRRDDNLDSGAMSVLEAAPVIVSERRASKPRAVRAESGPSSDHRFARPPLPAT